MESNTYNVFSITSGTTGKSYFGMTTKDVEVEAGNIFNLAERGGYNRVADHMVYDICIHGRSDFSVKLIESFDNSQDAKDTRAKLISSNKCRDAKGYNARRTRGIDLNAIEVVLTDDLVKVVEMGDSVENLKAISLVTDKPFGYIRLYMQRYERFVALYEEYVQKFSSTELLELFRCTSKDLYNVEWYINESRHDRSTEVNVTDGQCTAQ
jgi:hypothetical protein